MASDKPNDDGPAWGGDLDGEANDDYQPDIELSDEQTQDPTSHGANPSADFGDIGDDLGDDGAEYDPEAIGAPPPASPTSHAKPTPPRTTGGFIVSDDSDSDSDEEEAAAAASTGGADAESNVTPSAANVPSPGQDQVVAVEADPESAQLANGSSSLTDPTASYPAQPPAPVVPMPNQALDRTTVLENRVKEDPRGDMDAWLDLIGEYRRRNNMDEIRSVYNRFLEVFPQSVSPIQSLLYLPSPALIPLFPSPLTRRYHAGRNLGVLGRAGAKPQQLCRGRATFPPLSHARTERAPLDCLSELHSSTKRP